MAACYPPLPGDKVRSCRRKMAPRQTRCPASEVRPPASAENRVPPSPGKTGGVIMTSPKHTMRSPKHTMTSHSNTPHSCKGLFVSVLSSARTDYHPYTYTMLGCMVVRMRSRVPHVFTTVHVHSPDPCPRFVARTGHH